MPELNPHCWFGAQCKAAITKLGSPELKFQEFSHHPLLSGPTGWVAMATGSQLAPCKLTKFTLAVSQFLNPLPDSPHSVLNPTPAEILWKPPAQLITGSGNGFGMEHCQGSERNWMC